MKHDLISGLKIQNESKALENRQKIEQIKTDRKESNKIAIGY